MIGSREQLDRARAAHELPVHEALLLLESDLSRGLGSAEAERRLARFGPNLLPALRKRGAAIRFALQFRNPLVYVLLAAAAVSFGLGEPVDASVILGVVLANAGIGFAQESRAEQALEALASMVREEATVIRDGERRRIASERLVPGDVLVLQPGDLVAADVRLLEEQALEIDESALTGESIPSRKSLRPLAADTGVGDRSNMAYSGTLVSRGHATGVVVATGAQTEIGLIHRLIGEAAEVATPLTRKIAHFSKLLTVAILVLAALTYLVGLARGEDPGDLFLAAVALAVGAIPEGLPAAITITLAIGVERMARRHAIVRRLPAVETLGSTTVICTDKTGTLTENQMTVRSILAGGDRYEVSGAGYSPDGTICRAGTAAAAERTAALRECLLAGALCNDSRLVESDGTLDVLGDPTEGALLVAARKGGIDPERARRELPRVAAVPFESERRFMATIHAAGDGESLLYVKGAAETVLGMCSRSLDRDGRPAPVEAASIMAEADVLAARGLRVLAFASGKASEAGGYLDRASPPRDLAFVGLQAMMDPPRPEAVAAVAACRNAGMAVKMVTGDHAGTAAAVAADVGLTDTPGPAPGVMTGSEIARSAREQLVTAAGETPVFARVSAEQKLRLVEALQEAGEVVAMTGDGVNDAPALKRADIGVAMGRSGTQVAREASDIVLTDDNFASIRAAVEEGRRIFDNITKFIVWTLPTNIGEGLLIVTAIVAGVTLPILPVQILWINMTTAVALGLMLAFEPQEPGIMERPPGDPARSILTGGLLWRIVLVSALLLAGSFWLFEWAQGRDVPLAEARTVAVNVFVAGQIFYLFNCRSLHGSILRIGPLSNGWVLGGVATMVALQLAFTYASPMQSLFHSASIDAAAWLRILAVGLAVWAIVGLEKWVRARAEARRGASVFP